MKLETLNFAKYLFLSIVSVMKSLYLCIGILTNNIQDKNTMQQMAEMTIGQVLPPEAKVLMNHIYEYKKGVRSMILFTCNRRLETLATQRLRRQSIDFVVQPAGKDSINVYFGRRECLDAIRLFVTRPLNELTPEEDFILGALLGYDICAQCERYCERKTAASISQLAG